MRTKTSGRSTVVHATLAVLALALCATCKDRSTERSSEPVATPQPTTSPLPADDASSPSPPASEPPVVPPAAHAELARASNRFALALWARMPAGNLAMSPASISTALTIIWGGAKGETATQLQNVLQLTQIDGTQDVLLSRWGALYKSLQHPKRKATLALANRLYGEQSYPFDTIYFSIVRHAFDVWIEPVDFAGDPDGTRVKINQWVAERTAKRIPEILPPSSVDKDTRMVVVNAIYFRGDWVSPFDSSKTRPADFYVNGSKKRPVPTMTQTQSVLHTKAEGAAMIELPYAGDDVSMFVILPDARNGIGAVEKRLDSVMAALQRKLAKQPVRIALPKFKVDPPSATDLAAHLKALGIVDAFDAAKADLSNIAKPKNATDKLFISAVLHRAFVEVDEKGTEAAAATAVAVKAGGAPPAPIDFTADHPFLFVILDRASGLILFIGRVVDP